LQSGLPLEEPPSVVMPPVDPKPDVDPKEEEPSAPPSFPESPKLDGPDSLPHAAMTATHAVMISAARNGFETALVILTGQRT
jgi:hypothetical protein